MAALLHDRRALAIVLTDNDEGAAGDAARRQIGERVGGDIGADRRFPRSRPTNGIMHRGRKGSGGRRLAGARFEMNAELAQDVLRIGEHIHQMRDGCSLIADNIADTALQQRLGDGEDALAAEFLAGADLELLDFFLEGSFGHDSLRQPIFCSILCRTEMNVSYSASLTPVKTSE